MFFFKMIFMHKNNFKKYFEKVFLTFFFSKLFLKTVFKYILNFLKKKLLNKKNNIFLWWYNDLISKLILITLFLSIHRHIIIK